jgi:hypothetical protein
VKIQDLCSTDIAVAVPVLSAIVGLFGALTLTAIVAAVIVGVCVCRRQKSEGREIPFVSYYHTDDI